MIGCLRTRVRKQPIIALYSESEKELKFYSLEAMLLEMLVHIRNGENGRILSTCKTQELDVFFGLALLF